jgi:hypothetical protein
MNTPTEDHKLLRWLDGEMSVAEKTAFEAYLQTDPPLKAEAEFMQQISRDLRTHLPPEMPVPYPDFFNSQIQARLAQEENRQSLARASRGERFRGLRLSWLVAGVAAMLALSFARWMPSETPTDQLVHSIYAPSSSIQARSYHSGEAQATVLVLDGLEEMPANRKIVGFHLTRSEVDEAMVATTLFDTEGKAVAVMSTNAKNQPVFLTADSHAP